MSSRLLRLALVAILPLGGCTFSRAVVNPRVRDIDTSWIVPGKTTRRDVIDRIGYPPHVRELGGVKPKSFRWTTYDLSTQTLAVGYIVTPTFDRSSRSNSKSSGLYRRPVQRMRMCSEVSSETIFTSILTAALLP